MFNPDVLFDITVADVEEDPVYFADRFIEGRMLAFRHVEWDASERGRVLWAIGLQCGWGPGRPPQHMGGEKRVTFTYDADYSGIMGPEFIASTSNTPKNLALSWHLENPCWRFPQIAGGWYMQWCDINPESGQTGFIDGQDLFNKLTLEQQNFVLGCELLDMERDHEWESARPNIKNIEYLAKIKGGRRKTKIEFVDDTYQIVYTFPAVQKHPTTGDPVLRISPTQGTFGGGRLLHTVNGEEPTEQDHETFTEIRKFVSDQTFGGETEPFWWSWKTGDFLIVDLHRSVHAVKAGFEPQNRKFEGMWCHESHNQLGEEPQWEIDDWDVIKDDPCYHKR